MGVIQTTNPLTPSVLAAAEKKEQEEAVRKAKQDAKDKEDANIAAEARAAGANQPATPSAGETALKALLGPLGGLL